MGIILESGNPQPINYISLVTNGQQKKGVDEDHAYIRRLEGVFQDFTQGPEVVFVIGYCLRIWINGRTLEIFIEHLTMICDALFRMGFEEEVRDIVEAWSRGFPKN